MADTEQTPVVAAETKVDEPAKPAETATVAEVATEQAPAANGNLENGDAAPEQQAPVDDTPPTIEDTKTVESTEPPVKKPRKNVDKTKKTNRRSSSRLVNVASGVVLSNEISSDNLPKGC